MCESHGLQGATGDHRGAGKVADISDLKAIADFVVAEPEMRRSGAGFIGYGSTKPGDRVLIAVDSLYDPDVADLVSAALRRRGATVDLITLDAGPDREFAEDDEIDVIMRRGISWRDAPRRWDYVPWITELGSRYDLVIHGKGSPVPKTDFRYEAIPWLQRQHLAQGATGFPRPLHILINEKAWEPIWGPGMGGTVRITDPEGTDLTYTLNVGYYEGRRQFSANPGYGHLFAHGVTPILADEDATGRIRGTTAHFTRPFPAIDITVENGLTTAVTGGGRYGERWLQLLEETKDLQYPHFPRPGLFWLQEVAIGTNPKIRRPANIHLHSSGGGEWERRRSGVIHLGLGTMWLEDEERWAAEHGHYYGHLHVHLLFPTLDVTTQGGDVIRIIDHGRLTALDDPEVRRLASTYGDPDVLLAEDWIPNVPGITGEGALSDYLADPAPYVYADAPS